MADPPPLRLRRLDEVEALGTGDPARTRAWRYRTDNATGATLAILPPQAHGPTGEIDSHHDFQAGLEFAGRLAGRFHDAGYPPPTFLLTHAHGATSNEVVNDTVDRLAMLRRLVPDQPLALAADAARLADGLDVTRRVESHVPLLAPVVHAPTLPGLFVVFGAVDPQRSPYDYVYPEFGTITAEHLTNAATALRLPRQAPVPGLPTVRRVRPDRTPGTGRRPPGHG